MNDDSNGTHSRDDIWNGLGEVRAAQSATDARLGALESAVDSGFRTLTSELRSVADRVNAPADPPNYAAWIIMGLSLLGLFGGYAFLITGPLQADIARLERSAEGDATRMLEAREKIAALEAELRLTRERLNDVDRNGSRRWNEGLPQVSLQLPAEQ